LNFLSEPASQSELIQLQDAFEMGEQHFDLLAQPTRAAGRRLRHRGGGRSLQIALFARRFGSEVIWRAESHYRPTPHMNSGPNPKVPVLHSPFEVGTE